MMKHVLLIMLFQVIHLQAMQQIAEKNPITDEIFALVAKRSDAKVTDEQDVQMCGDHQSRLKDLIEQHKQLLDAPDKEGIPPLFYAAMVTSYCSVRTLVENGANVDLVDPYGDKASAFIGGGLGKLDATYQNRVHNDAYICTQLLLNKQTPARYPIAGSKSKWLCFLL